MKIINKNKKIISSLLLFSFSLFSFAYEDGIRIAWDYNQRTFHNAGVYARMKKLKNQDLLLVYSYGSDVYLRKQIKGNKTWNSAVLVSRDNTSTYNYTNSEIIELDNGKLIYVWNARPKNGINSPYKIMIKFSDNEGETWNSEKDVYIAGTTAREGCWEPALLQLPSGELHLYFANEYNTPSNDQNIILLRSFTEGETWNSPEIVSYRVGYRDGMPVPVFLQNEKVIALAIEDNGIDGVFKPVIIYTTMADNWKSGIIYGNSSKRWYALRSDYQLKTGVYGGAPYLIQLSTGETVLSFQSQENRTNGSSHEYSNMQVYISDKNIKNFSKKSTPFPYLSSTSQALWNSLCQTTDSSVVAVSSISGLSENNGIWSITGKLLYPMESSKIFDKNRDWAKATSLFIGAESQASLNVKSMWDNDSLYFFFEVKDKKKVIATDENSPLWDTDGVEVYLDPKNTNSDSLVSGLYKILVNINNSALLNTTLGSGWVFWNPKINYRLSTSLENYYIELAIPWNDIGGIPLNSFGLNFKLHNNDGASSNIVHENLSGCNPDRPATWMKCSLLNSVSINKNLYLPENDKLVVYPNLLKKGENINLRFSKSLIGAEIKIFEAMSGKCIFNTISTTETFTVENLFFSGVAIIAVKTESGNFLYNKIIMT